MADILGNRFELGDLVGAGGMGRVYRAHDSRLGREVAIKLLAAELADDGDSLRRFEREARAVAALSHPNILTGGTESRFWKRLLEGLRLAGLDD